MQQVDAENRISTLAQENIRLNRRLEKTKAADDLPLDTEDNQHKIAASTSSSQHQATVPTMLSSIKGISKSRRTGQGKTVLHSIKHPQWKVSNPT